VAFGDGGLAGLTGEALCGALQVVATDQDLGQGRYVRLRQYFTLNCFLKLVWTLPSACRSSGT
jgi:hypothetical protein